MLERPFCEMRIFASKCDEMKIKTNTGDLRFISGDIEGSALK